MTNTPPSKDESLQVVAVLNDGETYTDISGCVILEVPQGIVDDDIDVFVKDNFDSGTPILKDTTQEAFTIWSRLLKIEELFGKTLDEEDCLTASDEELDESTKTYNKGMLKLQELIKVIEWQVPLDEWNKR
jgi:hypothetical protein|tara:strand:- start:472 stop:864 length:393 start_codon:yes stop_codon:yes gene_type:complete